MKRHAEILILIDCQHGESRLDDWQNPVVLRSQVSPRMTRSSKSTRSARRFSKPTPTRLEVDAAMPAYVEHLVGMAGAQHPVAGALVNLVGLAVVATVWECPPRR